MQVRWKKQKSLNPETVLAKIASAALFSEEGEVSLSGFEAHDAKTALYSMVDFGTLDIPTSIRSRLVNGAVWNGLKEDRALPRDLFIRCLEEQTRTHLGAREENLDVLTSMSISTVGRLRTLRSGDCNFRFLAREFPRTHLTGRATVENAIHVPLNHTPPSYMKVVVRIKAKDGDTAVHAALQETNVVRAILCLLVNREMVIQFTGAARSANRVRLGGLHTLHREDGSIYSTREYWYETPYSVHEAIPIDLTREKILRRLLKRLGSLKVGYRRRIRRALLLYVRAFDDADPETAFVKGWGALECISSVDGSNYDVVTRRCSFLFSERQYHQQILEHLRESRNATIHAGETREDHIILCYQLQRYFRQMVLFHLRRNGAEDFEESLSFLDLPGDIAKLQSTAVRIREAVRFLKPR